MIGGSESLARAAAPGPPSREPIETSLIVGAHPLRPRGAGNGAIVAHHQCQKGQDGKDRPPGREPSRPEGRPENQAARQKHNPAGNGDAVVFAVESRREGVRRGKTTGIFFRGAVQM